MPKRCEPRRGVARFSAPNFPERPRVSKEACRSGERTFRCRHTWLRNRREDPDKENRLFAAEMRDFARKFAAETKRSWSQLDPAPDRVLRRHAVKSRIDFDCREIAGIKFKPFGIGQF